MAVRAPTLAAAAFNGLDITTWAGLLQSSVDSGGSVSVAGAKSILAILVAGGTLGVAGAVTWQGSVDNVDWFTMNSDIGAPAAAISAVLNVPVMLKERPLWIRPLVTAGDGTT